MIFYDLYLMYWETEAQSVKTLKLHQRNSGRRQRRKQGIFIPDSRPEQVFFNWQSFPNNNVPKKHIKQNELLTSVSKISKEERENKTFPSIKWSKTLPASARPSLVTYKKSNDLNILNNEGQINKANLGVFKGYHQFWS